MSAPLTCPKMPHDNPLGGYLHGPDDDRPYDVDGVLYCGRCHWSCTAAGQCEYVERSQFRPMTVGDGECNPRIDP